MSILTSAAMRRFRRLGNIRNGEKFSKSLKWMLKSRDLMVYKALG
jgi:hypothetical protein